MATALRIPPAPGERVIADPCEIFAALRPEAETRSWVLWGETWLTTKPDAGLDALHLEEEVARSSTGRRMSWGVLAGRLGDLLQVIDGTFVGCGPDEEVAEYPATPWQDLHRAYEFVVTADDSSFWWVTAPEKVSARVRRAFPHAHLSSLY